MPAIQTAAWLERRWGRRVHSAQSSSPEAPVGEACLSPGPQNYLLGDQGDRSSYCWGQDPEARHSRHFSCVALAPSKRRYFLPSFCCTNVRGRKKAFRMPKKMALNTCAPHCKDPPVFLSTDSCKCFLPGTKHQMQSYELPGWDMFKISMKYTQYTLMLFKQPQYILFDLVTPCI